MPHPDIPPQVYLDRTKVTMLRVIPFSGQFGFTRHGDNIHREKSDLFGADPLGNPRHLELGSPLVPFNAINVALYAYMTIITAQAAGQRGRRWRCPLNAQLHCASCLATSACKCHRLRS